MKHTKEMAKVLKEFENISDFYSDTEAIVIHRFNLLNKYINKNNDSKLHNELQKGFGEFLINRGKIYIKESQNQDE